MSISRKTIENVVDYFLIKNNNNDNNNNEDYKVKERLLVLFLLFTTALSILMLPTYIYLEAKRLLGSLCILFVVCVSILFYFRKSRNLKTGSFLFISFTLAFLFFNIIYTGAINSVLVIWLIIIPILAILLNNGWIKFSVIGCFVILLLLVVIQYFSVEFPNEFEIEGGVYLNFFSRINFMFSVVLIIYLYAEKSQADKELLEQSNKDLEQFAYIASHDMKAPLRNIMSFTQLLKRKLSTKIQSDEGKYFEHILRNGYQMNELIQGILDISKIEKQETLDLQETNLNQVMSKVKMNLAETIEQKNTVLKYDNLPIVTVNEPQITQLFQNLIENGIKYNRNEQPEITISYKRGKKNIHIYFKDNGIGIAPKYYDKIFEMFKRLHSGYEFTGTGIGLAICKKIALRHKGDLVVHQSSDEGTTFKLSLPI